MDINEPLPEEHALFPLDKFLYKSSLFFHQNKPKPSWLILFSPILSFIFALVFATQRVVVLVWGDNPLILRAMGDVTDVIGLRFHFNIAFVLLALNTHFLQLVFYRNYRIGVKPTFLRVIYISN